MRDWEQNSPEEEIGRSYILKNTNLSFKKRLRIFDNYITPTINYSSPDPECDLNYVPNSSIEKSVTNALSNSFGFGGHNATLALGKYN